MMCIICINLYMCVCACERGRERELCVCVCVFVCLFYPSAYLIHTLHTHTHNALAHTPTRTYSRSCSSERVLYIQMCMDNIIKCKSVPKTQMLMTKVCGCMYVCVCVCVCVCVYVCMCIVC